MKTVLLLLALSLLPSHAAAQCSSAQTSVPGRFAVLGYAETLNVMGNLGTAFGGMAGDNGILFVLPAQNVTLHPAMHMWQADLGSWTGTQCFWTLSTYQPVNKSLFYPLSTLPAYYWLDGTPDPSPDLGPGIITCYGWDNTLTIPGDLIPGSKNGILFALPVSHASTVAQGLVWDVQMYVYDLVTTTSRSFKETVAPTAMCGFQPVSQAWLDSITGGW